MDSVIGVYAMKENRAPCGYALRDFLVAEESERDDESSIRHNVRNGEHGLPSGVYARMIWSTARGDTMCRRSVDNAISS